jgi:hypothetical protein
MNLHISWLMLVASLLAFIPAELGAGELPPKQVPQKYVGQWQGISGAMSLKETAVTGTATVSTDIGSEIKSFSFSVAPDGKVTGQGTAICWFDVTANADLVTVRQKHEAHLEGGKPSFEFTIEGEMTPDGRLQLHSVSRSRLTLITAGTRNDRWTPFNVFGPGRHPVSEQRCRLVLDVDHGLPRGRRENAIRVAWKAEKFGADSCGKLAEEITFIEEKYLPYADFVIEKYGEASKNPDVWQKLDANQAQDAVLKAVQQRYAQSTVGAETRMNPDGSATSTFYPGDEPYPWILTFRQEHEKYFRDRADLDSKQFKSLAYPAYVQWSLMHNRNAWIEVNKRLANERLGRLKKECRQKCDEGCCGKAP